MSHKRASLKHAQQDPLRVRSCTCTDGQKLTAGPCVCSLLWLFGAVRFKLSATCTRFGSDRPRPRSSMSSRVTFVYMGALPRPRSSFDLLTAWSYGRNRFQRLSLARKETHSPSPGQERNCRHDIVARRQACRSPVAGLKRGPSSGKREVGCVVPQTSWRWTSTYWR